MLSWQRSGRPVRPLRHIRLSRVSPVAHRSGPVDGCDLMHLAEEVESAILDRRRPGCNTGTEVVLVI